MNTKLLNELELHLHNSELALQLARKAVAELKGENKPFDFYAKLEGFNYSHKPCSTDTCEPKTFLHRKLLEKRLPFQTLLAGLGVATPDKLEVVYDLVFKNKLPPNYAEFKAVHDFIENYKPHGEV